MISGGKVAMLLFSKSIAIFGIFLNGCKQLISFDFAWLDLEYINPSTPDI